MKKWIFVTGWAVAPMGVCQSDPSKRENLPWGVQLADTFRFRYGILAMALLWLGWSWGTTEHGEDTEPSHLAPWTTPLIGDILHWGSLQTCQDFQGSTSVFCFYTIFPLSFSLFTGSHHSISIWRFSSSSVFLSIFLLNKSLAHVISF